MGCQPAASGICISCTSNDLCSPFHSEFLPSTSRLTAGRLAGNLADEIWLDFEIFKILYRLIYLNFTLSISLQCLIVLEVHFILLFSKKVYLGCVLCA